MAEKIGQVIPEEIHIQRVSIMNFAVRSTEEYINMPKEIPGMKISLGKETSHDIDKGLARYRLYFHFEGMDEKEVEIGLSAKVDLEYFFRIENFSNFINEDKGQKKVDIRIGASLMAIAYSTSRGIILEKTQGTGFNGIIIPVIDSTKFLTEEEQKNS